MKIRENISSLMVILVISKILGFLKMTIIAQLFGTSRPLDIFWAAFTVPDMIFNILVAGAVNAAIIPVFSSVFHTEGEDELNLLFKRLNALFVSAFTIISILMFIFAPAIGNALISSDWLHSLLGTSSTIGTEDITLFTQLMRIMLISPLLLGVSSLITSYLQVRKKFLVTALSPLFYNFAMIIVSLFLVKVFNFGVVGVAWSVVVGSALHLAVQLPTLFKFLFEKNRIPDLVSNIKQYLSKEILKVLKLSFPRMLGLAGEQVNVFINTLISFTLSAGSLSAYRFAFSLHLFPVQIFGGAVSQVALTSLSEHAAKNEKDKFEDVFNKAIRQTLFFILPTVAVLLVLRLPIVRLVYGLDTWWGTVVTSWCLALLTISMISQSIVLITLRAFYAIHETFPPLIATVVAIIVNIFVGYFFTNFFSHYLDWRPILTQVWIQLTQLNNSGLIEVVRDLGRDIITWMTTRNNSDAAVGGLAFAISVSFVAEMVTLLLLLNRKIKVVTWKKTIKPLLPMLLNSLIMGIGMYFVFKVSDFNLDTSRTVYVFALTVLTSLYGAASYALGSRLFKVAEFDLVLARISDYVIPIYNRYIKRK